MGSARSGREIKSRNMKKLLCICFVLAAFMASCKESEKSSDPKCYIFTYFTDKDQAAGLHIAYSGDGLEWKELNGGNPIIKPEIGNQKIMRDPSITRGPDGTYHLVWTVSWEDTGIGYSHSKDLVNWSEQQFIPVMSDTPGTRNCWAPEVFYDEDSEYFYIVWSSTVDGRHKPVPHTSQEAYNNPRMYFTKTKDFISFTPAELFYDKDFAVIDGFLFKEEGTYHLFLKNENSLPAEKNIRISTSASIEGPYGEPSLPITDSTYWAEGASCLKVGDSFFMYYDKYHTGRGYGAKMSKDLATWEDVTDRLSVPQGMKHGTPLEIPYQDLEQLLAL